MGRWKRRESEIDGWRWGLGCGLFGGGPGEALGRDGRRWREVGQGRGRGRGVGAEEDRSCFWVGGRVFRCRSDGWMREQMRRRGKPG